MKAPVNTAKQASDDPLGTIVNTLAFGASGGIERQEAEGQRSFVDSETLPAQLQDPFIGETRGSCRAILQDFGVKFLGPCDGDDLFQYVTLPDGWKKQPTDHSMWSKLVDEKGRERAAIFYKAAFYDRRAHLSLTPRFSISRDYDRKTECVFIVKDCERVIFSTEPRKIADKSWEHDDVASAEARAWVAERYPDWESPAAYWGGGVTLDHLERQSPRVGTVVKLWELPTPTASLYANSKPPRRRIRPSRGEFTASRTGPATDEPFAGLLNNVKPSFVEKVRGDLRQKHGWFPSPEPLPNVHRAAVVGLADEDAKALKRQLRNQRKRDRRARR